MATTAVFTSAPRTVTANSPSFRCGRRWYLVVDVTAISATPTVTPKVEMLDSVSGKWITLWTAAAALTATGTYVYVFTDSEDPLVAVGDVTEVAEIYTVDDLRVTMTHADTDSMTYSVGSLQAVA